MLQKTAQHPHQKLKEKWIKRRIDLQETILARHGNHIYSLTSQAKNYIASALAGVILLTTPATSSIAVAPTKHIEKPVDQPIDKSVFAIADLQGVVPQDVRPLTPQEEQQIGEVLKRDFGVDATAELQGIRLNRSYGYIGQEQHLARYPGDNMTTHFASGDDGNLYYPYGMAPGLGAYGYFAPSQGQMSEEDNLREKYYIAVQTFLSPGYHENTRAMNEFFKFHKMLVVNPQNGKAVVAVIGDAGPAAWTGKHLGGSPEVMHYLERVDGYQRGPVLYYFINDPDNKVPLGPVEVVQ